MPTSEERKKQLLRAGEESKIATVWMAEHIDDYVQSEANAKAIGDILDDHSLPFTHKSLDEAFAFAKSHGWDFTKTNTVVPRTAAPATVAPAPVTPVVPIVPAPVIPAVPAEEPLPEIPNWFPKMENNADLRLISVEKFKELYYGKAGEKFKARLVAVKKRGL